MNRLGLGLVFGQAVLSVKVLEAKFKKGKSGRKTQDLYCTVNTESKKRSTTFPNSTNPKFNFSVDEVITDLGTEDKPATLEIGLWGQKNSLAPRELHGIAILPIVNLADKKEHTVWIDMKDQTGKEYTGWTTHVRMQFSCDIKSLKIEKEV